MAKRKPASPFLDIRVGAQYLAEKYPEYLKEQPITTGEPTTFQILSYRADLGIKNNFFNSMVDSFKIAMSPDPKMTRFALNMQKRSAVREANPNVAAYIDKDPRRAEDLGGLVGDIAEIGASIVSDPISYIGGGTVATAAKAFGRSATATGAATFGGIGALSSYTSQYVNTPNVKASEVALWGAIGGVLGGLGSAGLSKAPRVSPDAGATSVPQLPPPAATAAATVEPFATMNPESLQEVVRGLAQKQNIRYGDIHTTAEMAGVNLPVPYVKKLTQEANGIQTAMALRAARSAPAVYKIAHMLDDPKIAGLKDRIALKKTWRDITDTWNNADMHLKLDMVEPLRNLINKHAVSVETKKKGVAKIARQIQDQQRELQRQINHFEKTNPWQNPSPPRVGPSKPKPAPKPEALPLEDQIDRYYSGLPGGQTLGINVRDMRAKLPGVPREKVERAMKRLQQEGLATFDPHNSRLFMPDTIANQRKTKLLLADKKQKIAEAARITRQSGMANQKMLNTIALASVGTVVGYNYGDEEGAAVGAILGGLAPWTMGKIIGKFSDFTATRTAEGAGEKVAQYINDANTFIRPTKQISRMGSSGKLFASQLEHAEDMTNLQIADGLVTYNKLKNYTRELTDEEGSKVADILEGKLSPLNQPEHIRRAAQSSSQVFKQVAKQAYEAGVWSRQQYTDALNKKYFPRFYDEARLASKEGEDEFFRRMQNTNWTEDSLRNTIAALTGSKTKAELFIKATRKNGDKFIIDGLQAKQLLKERGNHIGGTSTHLDHQRKINLGKMDYLLDPFRIRNPDKIMDRYLNDVYRRIEHARVFGKNDELALETLAKIEKDMLPSGNSVQAVKLAREFYMKQKGDSAQSWILQQHQQAAPMLKAFNGKVAAFEVFKLAYSQILQPTSALVNGTTALSRTMPIRKALATNIKTLFQSLKNTGEHADFAQRAASGINVGLIDHISTATSEATLFGRSEFATNRLKWINSPQGFLEAIQFFRVEKFTQRWATMQGKALFEHLMEKNEAILNGTLTKANEIKSIRKQMEELGLDWNKRSQEFTMRDQYQASLRFNRAVNFIDGSRQLPHVWNSPYASTIRMYKTFSYRQGGFVMDNIIDPLKAGNWKPAAVFLGASAPAGWTVNQIRDFIKADDREYSNTAALIRSMSMAGGLGYFVDLINAAAGGDYDVFKTMIGAGPADILRTTAALPDAIGGNWKPLAAAVSRALPEVPGGFKRSFTEAQGITKPFSDPNAANRTFTEELRRMWKAVEADKKRVAASDNVDLNLDLDLDLDLGI